MKKTAIILIIALAFFACDDKDDNNTNDDNEVKERTATISVFGGSKTATVKGNLTKPQLDDSADKIKNRLNTSFDTSSENNQNLYKEVFDRGVIYIVEANPVGYTNLKTIGDGKTIYIPLDKVDTQYVVDGVGSIWQNGSEVAKATPTANKGEETT